MDVADETILAAAFPQVVGVLLQRCEQDGDLREVCEDFAAMARLAARAPSDLAVRENLVELKHEINVALQRSE